MKRQVGVGVVSAVLLVPLALFGKCPIAPNGALELRAPAGNLIIDTTGTDSVEVKVSNPQIVVQETCQGNVVTVGATMAAVNGLPDWNIRVPRTVALDLSTQGGNIQVGDTDGPYTQLRTSGGRVLAGSIKGNALIFAVGEVKTGNIGGNAEIRGNGGQLQVGDIGGEAALFSTGGDITVGTVKGSVKVDTGSGSVSVRESNGNLVVTTKVGDITSNYVRGAFDGKTEFGTINIQRVGSWVRAITGTGDIFFRLVPTNLAGDLHVTAEAVNGTITMHIPKAISATIDAIVEKPALNASRIITNIGSARSLFGLGRPPGGPERQHSVLNDGKNPIKAKINSGTIQINLD